MPEERNIEDLGMCQECGAIVFTPDVELHQSWHEQIAAVAKMAQRAYSMTRPIG